MTKIQTISPDNSAPYKLDNEETNEVGLSAVLDFIAGTDDMVLHHATFVSDQRCWHSPSRD